MQCMCVHVLGSICVCVYCVRGARQLVSSNVCQSSLIQPSICIRYAATQNLGLTPTKISLKHWCGVNLILQLLYSIFTVISYVNTHTHTHTLIMFSCFIIRILLYLSVLYANNNQINTICITQPLNALISLLSPR